MPSLQESRRQVEATIADELDHEAILASLQDEIDEHNATTASLRDDTGRSRRSRREATGETTKEPRTKFRFKGGVKDPREDRKRRYRQRRPSDDDDDARSHPRQHKRKRHTDHSTHEDQPEQKDEGSTAHPFPREPLSPTADNPPDAFRASLFDALADDEGAAAYWESVYNQPIHVYPRPSMQNERTGKLEQMSDDEYVAYVKEKMWEKKNPETVFERKRKESERKREEEERTKKREEYVRSRERKKWKESQRWKAGKDEEAEGEDDGYEYVFAGEGNRSTSGSEALESEYATAWTKYLNDWKVLLTTNTSAAPKNVSTTIPWPVLTGQPVIKTNIESFMRHAPVGENANAGRLKVLKSERLRWHPDKIQQRFGDAVDEGTMKLVTGVFQIADQIVKDIESRLK